jgi:AcrR family transcriptional regulator
MCPVVAARRIGAETSRTRAALLDAAEDLMIEEGYAAVTSRRVAAAAGVKPALVHYYFRTMDDLFLALYRRRAEDGLERQAKALAQDQPLWALWDFSRDPKSVAFTMESVALANHHRAIRDEISRYAERFRVMQVDVLSHLLDSYGIGIDGLSPIVVAVLMSSVSRFLVIEEAALGMFSGHAETVEAVERLLTRLEGERRSGPRNPRRNPGRSSRRGPGRQA